MLTRFSSSFHGPSLLSLAMLLIAASGLSLAQTSQAPRILTDHDPHLSDFQALEFRRYKVKDGERKHFAHYFDAYFPEAFQQLGAIAAGSFSERKNGDGFTWIRGFHSIDDRAVVNAAFYYGSVWNEHHNTLNDLMTDSDNVLLLRPLSPERGVPILPAVDPVAEPNGAQGIIVAQIFSVKKDAVEAFAQKAESAFSNYRTAGAREAGVLITLDAKNNFPQLPIRTDGPYLVWLGIVKDNSVLKNTFIPVTEQFTKPLSETGLLRETPELVILDPTPRSRLRWLPSWK